jgi:hypothetical protein
MDATVDSAVRGVRFFVKAKNDGQHIIETEDGRDFLFFDEGGLATFEAQNTRLTTTEWLDRHPPVQVSMRANTPAADVAAIHGVCALAIKQLEGRIETLETQIKTLLKGQKSSKDES